MLKNKLAAMEDAAPIIDPSALSEEQKERIIKAYLDSEAGYWDCEGYECGARDGFQDALEWLFGENLFKIKNKH